jgi:hypothetical protein
MLFCSTQDLILIVMQNNIRKTQNTQIPSVQGRAAEVTTSINQSIGAAPTQVIRATLHHLDGATSQIVITMPKFSHWSDCNETAAMMLNEYIFYLASKWVKISSFKTEIGSLGNDGMFLPGPALYRQKDIPLDRVFSRGNRGKWITLDQAKQIDQEGLRSC